MNTSESRSPTLNHSERIYRHDVPRYEVARSFLKSELPNVLKGDRDTITAIVDASVDDLAVDSKLWRFLEAIAYSDRMNDVFQQVTNQSVDWTEIDLPIAAITMTGTKPHINDIVYSPEINGNPVAFANYLNDYFANHPSVEDDPNDLNELRPRNDVSVTDNTTLLTIEKGEKIAMLDGTHRLLAIAMLGKTSVRAFAGIQNEKQRLTMIGDSTFLTLRKLYERLDSDEQRAAVMQTTALLARDSLDGDQAIQNYWIEHPRADAIKNAGAEVLRIIEKLRSLER